MSRLFTHDQHFLRSPRIVAELIGHSNIRKNDTVYDLGAGSGVLTSALIKRCKQVVAVEIEPQALSLLRKNLGSIENVQIIAEDMLEITIPSTPYKIFANIPFSLSAKVVQKYTNTVNPPRSMYLIVQKQFAKKLVPGDDHFTSQLAAEIGPWFSVRIRKPLRKTDFTPPPAVDTVLLEIKPHEHEFIKSDEKERYREFIEQCFSRQLYFQSLNREGAGISSEKRPSQLTLPQWCRLYENTVN